MSDHDERSIIRLEFKPLRKLLRTLLVGLCTGLATLLIADQDYSLMTRTFFVSGVAGLAYVVGDRLFRSLS